MPRSDRMSLKWFLDAVEGKLESFTPEQLRSILMNMALQIPPSERQEFLDKLTPPLEEVEKLEEEPSQESLLDDIEAFAEEVEDMVEEGVDEYYNERSWGDWEEEDDETGAYEEQVDEMESLFEKVNMAFDNGDLKLARDAYNKLFSIFAMEDDYGGGIRTSSFESIREIFARYLRSVYETESHEDRIQIVYDEMQRIIHIGFYIKIGLEDMIQIRRKPLPDEERFLNDWILFLKPQDDVAADYWLREAVHLAKGADGLKELALSEGKKRPRAFLDWVEALMDEDKYSDAVAAAQQAGQFISSDLPIRSAIADHLRKAAEKLNNRELVSDAIWEAFYAQPQTNRLLDVWNSTADESQRIDLMQKASKRIREHLASKQPVYYSHHPFGGEFFARVEKSSLAHAYLLSRDWESAHALVVKENELGWSQSSNPQGLVVICFLGLASGKRPSVFPPNLSLLWNNALEDSLGYDGDTEAILPRLKSAYDSMFSKASLGQREESLLDWCLNTSKKRINSIVQNQHRRSYWKAATLTIACSEVLNLRGKAQEAQGIFEEIRGKFPRHSSFQAELRTAQKRR